MSNKRFTRDDYMEHRCSHREYYAQFVTQEVKAAVVFHIGAAQLQASTDAHLNDIPLVKWDRATAPYSRSLFKELGDGWSMAGHVCILKEAARQVIEARIKANEPAYVDPDGNPHYT